MRKCCYLSILRNFEFFREKCREEAKRQLFVDPFYRGTKSTGKSSFRAEILNLNLKIEAAKFWESQKISSLISYKKTRNFSSAELFLMT